MTQNYCFGASELHFLSAMTAFAWGISEKKADYINAFKQLLLSLSQTVNDFLHLHRNATQKWVDFDIKRHTHAFACFVFIFKINNEYDEILDKKCTSRGCNLLKNFKNVCKWRCDVEMASHMLDALKKACHKKTYLLGCVCLQSNKHFELLVIVHKLTLTIRVKLSDYRYIHLADECEHTLH